MPGPSSTSKDQTSKTSGCNDNVETASAAPEHAEPKATIREIYSFVPNTKTKFLMRFGIFFAACSGIVFPAMAWIFSGSFSDLSASTDSDAYLKGIRNLAFSFIVLGIVAFALMTAQTLLMELAATETTRNFKNLWFQSLLRQDMAYYDLRDVSGTATILSTNAIKFKRGIGRKLSDAVQFFVTVILGLVYGFWSNWQVSLLVLAVVPFMALSASVLVKLATTQTTRSSSSYAKAGSVVYATISSIRTVLSLNAVDIMINKFTDATEDAYEGATQDVVRFGCANGAMLASFLLSYVPVVLYGSYLVYSNVQKDGCDPSGSAAGNQSCNPDGEGIFGALFGISFAGSVVPQITASIEAFADARSAAYPALEAINRNPLVDESNGGASTQVDKSKTRQRRDSSVPLPRYAIDSSSPSGLKPKTVTGNIRFTNVTFSYPSRLETLVFDGFSLDVHEGKTVALVGTSGSGKSTVVQLIERFYDVNSGSITLDGNDLRTLNVQWLRSQIGFVSQEPKLFALSIKENIAIGCPGATFEQIEEAARKANAHDFIMSFRDGYDTECGDQGAQLSGGQKQRIAIARVLIRKPKIILLDEATSALDSESEAVVQEALDVLMQQGEQTILVIAHRLSTIKGADVIAVVNNGKVVETGSHDELLSKKGAYFDLVSAQKGIPRDGDGRPGDGESNQCQQPTIKANEESVETSLSGHVKSGDLTVTGSALCFKDVHFWYPSRPGNKIFTGLNLPVKEGETLAIVGPSGQGKSTIIQLIEQFYRPTVGVIEYHGVDMKELNIQWIRDQIALVGQEPVLFDTSIAENIRFGTPAASQKEIEEAARKANAHDFISDFPEGYRTQVGVGSSLQVSGGQKQRIAIARALLRKPKVLLLDEATSALDSASETIVQNALDKIMADKSQTTIVIAHRLSTLRNVDQIAFIEKGKVRELGTHDDLMSINNGRYKHFQSLQNLGSTEHIVENDEVDEKKANEKAQEDTEVNVDFDGFEPDKKRDRKNAQRARLMAKGDRQYFIIGGIGAIIAGLVFPGWGFVFAYMVVVLYYPVQFCDDSLDPPVVAFPQYGSCQDYWDDVAAYMKDVSFKIFFGLLGIMAAAIIGNMLMYTGFGYASERMNKRIRDATFKSLVRQEVAWFDLQPISRITTRLSDDATLIHSFSGQPIRMLCVNISSVLIGLVISFVYMWPFALVTFGILPFMSLGKALEIQTFMSDEKEDKEKTNANSSAGIVVESLLNIRIVASLTIERQRLEQFDEAMTREDPSPIRSNLVKSSTGGFSQIIQFSGFALMFWFGGWLLFNYPNLYDFQDFLISMFGLMFGISGLGIAMADLTDSKKASEAAHRIFEILDRKSEIDPLSDEGKKLE